MKNKLTLDMTGRESIVLMCDGNPGALNVLLELVDKNAIVDTDSVLGFMTTMCGMDESGIYGSDIWILYKDICGSDVVMLMALFRGKQMGLIREEDILHDMRCATHMRKLDIQDVYDRVVEVLPNFNKVSL